MQKRSNGLELGDFCLRIWNKKRASVTLCIHLISLVYKTDRNDVYEGALLIVMFNKNTELL